MTRDPETEHLRHEIRDTRERLSETLDELSVRLNPNRIKEQVKDNIREATVGRVENMARHASERVHQTRAGIMDTIRDNPIPAALIGVGLGWMLFNGRRHHEHGRGYVGDLTATTPRLRQDDAAGGMGESVSPIEETGIRERISDVGERAHRLEDRFSDTLHENPLAIGAAAVALGLVAGLAIPESQREHEVMGGTRDRLMNRVRESAEDMKEQVQTVAERVIDDAQTEAPTR